MREFDWLRSFQITGRPGECVGVEAFYRRQLICAEGAVEGLYQQQLAVAVDRQARLALDGAVEQAVGVGLLSASSRAMRSARAARRGREGRECSMA